MTNPLFSIIFVNYQSAESLQQSLAALQQPLQKISHEIIVINNDVQEQEKIDLLQKKFGLIVAHLSANFGFAKANNVGAKRAKGEILLFLNPDTLWIRGTPFSLAACLRSQGEAILGLRLLGPDGTDEAWSCGELPTLGQLFWRKITLWTKNTPWKEKTFQRVGWVSGAGLALYRTTYQKLEGFDESYFLYYEDVDLAARARQFGINTFRFPFLVFSHSRGQSHASLQSMKRAYFIGQRIYFSRHRSLIEYKILSFLHGFFQNAHL